MKKLKDTVKLLRQKQNNRYISVQFLDEEELHRLILYEKIDIADIPVDIRIKKEICYITAMRVSRYDFPKRTKYMKLFAEDLKNCNMLNDDMLTSLFKSYLSETLQYCMLCYCSDKATVDKELIYNFAEFLCSLPDELREEF